MSNLSSNGNNSNSNITPTLCRTKYSIMSVPGVCTCEDGFVSLKLLSCHTQGAVCEAGVFPQSPQLVR